jgi:hypothetical protein
VRGLVIAEAVLIGGCLKVPAYPCRGMFEIFLGK